MPERLYKQRATQGLCAWSSGCSRPLLDGSAYCKKHAPKRRRTQRLAMRKIRARRRATGLCIYCPQRRPNPAAPGGTTCTACRVRRRRVGDYKAKIKDAAATKAERMSAATKVGTDGRRRYHGQQKKGNQPHLQLDEQDLASARKAMDTARVGLHLYEQARAARMPAIQREDIRIAALDQLNMASGLLEEVLERRGYFKGHFQRRHGAIATDASDAASAPRPAAVAG